VSWSLVTLGELIVDERSGASLKRDEFTDSGIPVVPKKAISKSVELREETLVFTSEGKYLASTNAQVPTDFLITTLRNLNPDGSTLGLICRHGITERFMLAQGMHAFRVSDKLNPGYLCFASRQPEFRSAIQRIKVGSTQVHIRARELKEIKIPLPPLKEQKRIAAILDKADSLRRKRQQAIDLADDFLRAVFLDMFGDPVTNPKGWRTSSLGELMKVVSGATPSKSNASFWEGSFPWVSPKDMKVIEISDSIDHISEEAFEKTNLKKLPVGSILIVVRGMILIHTVPIAITTAAVSINQDIKAFICGDDVLPEFFLWFLKSQHENLLSKVSTAAHGTKRFDMADILSLNVFLPDLNMQRKFISICKKFTGLSDFSMLGAEYTVEQFKSLSQKAFDGQL